MPEVIAKPGGGYYGLTQDEIDDKDFQVVIEKTGEW